MLDFAYIETTDVINIPSQTNKGLYSGIEAYNDVKILPNSENYSAQFLVKNIQPYDDRDSKRYDNNNIGYR